MKIRSVEFCGSVVDPEAPFPGDLPQVAFAGRSNVGKSSLINVLLRRTKKRVAHVSGTPGKTQALNFYRVNDQFFLVDLPGFGFAQVPERVRSEWKALVEGYLARKDGPRAVVHLVDIRHGPTKDDLAMLDHLAETRIPTLVVLTKADKLNRERLMRRVPEHIEALGMDPDQVLPFSAKTGKGREDLLGALSDLLGLEERQAGPTSSLPLLLLLGGTLVGATGCGLLFPASPDGGATPEPSSASLAEQIDSEDVPPGLGTLRQEEISLTLRRGDLQIRVTPLDEAVIRVTAPDTYNRLAALARGHQEVFLQQTGSAVPFQLFLVSLYSETTEITFEPEALNVVSRGLRYRPAEVRSLTPGWETRRIQPREALMAVYAFPGEIALGQDLEVEYLDVRNRQWDRLLPVIDAERARVRARR